MRTLSRPTARSAAILGVAILLPALPFLAIGELPGEQWMSARDEHALPFAAMGTALLTLDVLLPVPSSVVGSLLGARLGFTAGFLAIWLGLVAGHLLGWTAGRLALARFDAVAPAVPTAWLVFATRSVPILAEGITVAAGASRMPLPLFFWAIAAGNACYAGVLAAVGIAIVGSHWAGPLLALPLLLAGAFALVWHRRNRPS